MRTSDSNTPLTPDRSFAEVNLLFDGRVEQIDVRIDELVIHIFFYLLANQAVVEEAHQIRSYSNPPPPLVFCFSKIHPSHKSSAELLCTVNIDTL